MKCFLRYVFKIVFSRTLIIILMLLLQILVLLGSFQWLGQYLSYIWEGMNFLGAILIIYIINKDEPTEFKLSWIIPICVFPIFGALIYIFVVGNFGGIGLRARLEKCMKESEGLLVTAPETNTAVEKCTASFRGFAHYMEHTVGFPVYHNSKARYYPLGEDKFEDLLIELRKAEKYIF